MGGEKILSIRIAPSILSGDFANLALSVKAVEKADLLHLDIMDGHFVPNITFGPAVVGALREHSDLPFDVHLMIENPDQYIEDFVKAGADLLTVHVEATRHLHRTICSIKEYGVEAGVALNPATPLASIEEILPELDFILIMSVNPGFGGQKFISSSLDKIKKLKSMLEERELEKQIFVDGGVDKTNATALAMAGANVLVAGSAVFGRNNVDLAISELREAGLMGL